MRHDRGRSAGARFRWLERITAGLLLTVVLTLVWMLLVANGVDGLRLDETAGEVIIVLALLVAALVLVTVVALLHTGS